LSQLTQTSNYAQGLRDGGTRGALYLGPALEPGKMKVFMLSFSAVKLKIISVSQFPV